MLNLFKKYLKLFTMKKPQVNSHEAIGICLLLICLSDQAAELHLIESKRLFGTSRNTMSANYWELPTLSPHTVYGPGGSLLSESEWDRLIPYQIVIMLISCSKEGRENDANSKQDARNPHGSD